MQLVTIPGSCLFIACTSQNIKSSAGKMIRCAAVLGSGIVVKWIIARVCEQRHIDWTWPLRQCTPEYLTPYRTAHQRIQKPLQNRRVVFSAKQKFVESWLSFQGVWYFGVRRLQLTRMGGDVTLAILPSCNVKNVSLKTSGATLMEPLRED